MAPLWPNLGQRSPEYPIITEALRNHTRFSDFSEIVSPILTHRCSTPNRGPKNSTAILKLHWWNWELVAGRERGKGPRRSRLLTGHIGPPQIGTGGGIGVSLFCGVVSICVLLP
jgi:hypothetical protein